MPDSDARKDKECPVRLIQSLHYCKRQGQAHVFTDVRQREAPKPIAEGTARSNLKQYLSTFLPAGKVAQLSTHSLRKGGATEAVHLGVPMPLIKAQGRWRSDAVYAYALNSDKEVLTLTQTLLQANT